MPELRAYFGYPTVLAVMIFVAIWMLTVFRRKGWVGTGENEPANDEAGAHGNRGRNVPGSLSTAAPASMVSAASNEPHDKKSHKPKPGK